MKESSSNIGKIYWLLLDQLMPNAVQDSKILVMIKKANIKSVIILLSLLSTLSILPSLKITLGKTASNDIMMMMMTMQTVLISSARV
jgi:hypothetical protein